MGTVYKESRKQANWLVDVGENLNTAAALSLNILTRDKLAP